jgi:hypothetical protein
MESRRVRFVDGGCLAVQGVQSFQFKEVAQGQADKEQGCEVDGFMQNHQNRACQSFFWENFHTPPLIYSQSYSWRK